MRVRTKPVFSKHRSYYYYKLKRARMPIPQSGIISLPPFPTNARGKFIRQLQLVLILIILIRQNNARVSMSTKMLYLPVITLRQIQRFRNTAMSNPVRRHPFTNPRARASHPHNCIQPIPTMAGAQNYENPSQ
jgi:hypothetical protein